LPVSGTESRSSVTSSPDGRRRSTGSAATVPASTTTLTVTMAPSFRVGNLAPPTDIPADTLCAVSATLAVAPGITAIDTMMLGQRLVTSAYLVDAEEPALVETGPATSAAAVRAGLASLGVAPDDLAHIVVTHIHLDHAGGVGTIAGEFPRSTVWVHERGAPHLADPSRLVASTERTYGAEQARRYFGAVEPTPRDRLRAVDEGNEIELGRRTLFVLYTPGHASHHIALADSETGAVFTGDALGVHIPDVRVYRPAIPPPDLDVELGIESIERIRARARSALLLSHFGAVTDIDEACEKATERMRAWSETVHGALDHTDDVEKIVSLLTEQGAKEYLADAGEPIDMERYDVLSSIRMNALGLIRYWRKREERERAEADQPSRASRSATSKAPES